MVGTKKIIILNLAIILNLSAGIFDDLMESLNIDRNKKEVIVENNKTTLNTDGKEEKIILVGKQISITNSEIKVNSKHESNNSKVTGRNGSVCIHGEKIEVENSSISASSSMGSKNVVIRANSGNVILGSHQ